MKEEERKNLEGCQGSTKDLIRLLEGGQGSLS